MRPEIAGVLSITTFDPALYKWRSSPSRFALSIFDVLSSFKSLLTRALRHLRPLPRDPFTDIGRTIPEFCSVGLAQSKELHGFSVDEKNVLEIDGEAARFLFQYAPKHVDMFPCNPAAYEQHHEIFSANDSINSAAHFAQLLTHDSRRSNPIAFPSPPGVCFTEEC